jgi:sensor histidine kinase YesM
MYLRWYSRDLSENLGEYGYDFAQLAAIYADAPSSLENIDNLKNNEVLIMILPAENTRDPYQARAYTKIINAAGEDHILEMTISLENVLSHTQPSWMEDCVMGAKLVMNENAQIVPFYGDRMARAALLEQYYTTGRCEKYYPLETDISMFRDSSITLLIQEKEVSESFRNSTLKIGGLFTLFITMILAGSYLTSWLLTRKVYQFIERVDYELSDGAAGKSDKRRPFKDFSNIEERVRELAYYSREYGKQLEAYEVEKKQLELELLQMRFNPHFLYNTLGSIRYQVKDPRIRKSIDSLIAYYRIVLSKGSRFISIASEIQMVREYLNLEIFAFDLKNVQCVYEIDEEAEKLQIVKHLLQPIVENALEHGVRSSENVATITIRARLQGENVVIEVEDTGIGMTPEQIETITTKPCSSPVGGGYGVYNVIQRIKTYYGSDYGVEFTSELGKGTVVTITIPQERMADEVDPQKK